VRVLAVGNMYPPHHFGGYELVWRSAMHHLRSGGHDVHVLTTDLLTDSAEAEDPDVHRELRWHWRPAGFARQSLRERVAMARHNHAVLERHLARLRPQVVSWWSMGGLSLTLIEAVRRKELPAVAFVHDDWLLYGPHVDGWLRMFGGRKSAAAPLAERVAGIPARVDLGGAARWVFVSEATRRRAATAGLRSTAVAHSGIDAAFLEPAPLDDWGWRLLYVGRLDERKGVHTAIEALRHLPEEARLRVVGGWDESEAGRLRMLAGGLGVAGRVSFDGQLERQALPAVYAAADAVLFPVVWEEPWGLVPLEAMGMGRPVVATGRGGSAEYLEEGRNCLLFRAGDAEDLARAVRRLAADAAFRERLRVAGRETAARHTEASFNQAVEGFLADAVEPAGRLVHA
jgi:glycosyltransferase involved in cell wall biosynthesis